MSGAEVEERGGFEAELRTTKAKMRQNIWSPETLISGWLVPECKRHGCGARGGHDYRCPGYDEQVRRRNTPAKP